MAVIKKIKNRRMRRAARVRRALNLSRENALRITVFRSLNHIYAQVIDDMKGQTIASCSSYEIEGKRTKTETAFEVGKKLAQKLENTQDKKFIFDRGHFLFHGRVKALADGLRNSGLVF